MTKLGYQIPNFNYPNGSRETLFEDVVAQTLAAESSGFDTVFVMDHFYQLPGLGNPDDYMLECYSILSALAARTSKINLGSLVTGNTYRNPTFLAKTITTLDVISGGRALLGIGAGWFELEHDALGFEFGTFTDRFEKLEEALQIILPMLNGERPTFSGKHYSTIEAINEPQPLHNIPVMIGGSGEKKTLRMVAQYADESNLVCNRDEIPRKLEVLNEHCDRMGRDRNEICVSWLGFMGIAPTAEEAEIGKKEFFQSRGIDWDNADDDFKAMLTARMIFGDPDQIKEQIQGVLDLGLDGVTLNMPANGHDPEMVALAGETLAPLFNQ